MRNVSRVYIYRISDGIYRILSIAYFHPSTNEVSENEFIQIWVWPPLSSLFSSPPNKGCPGFPNVRSSPTNEGHPPLRTFPIPLSNHRYKSVPVTSRKWKSSSPMPESLCKVIYTAKTSIVFQTAFHSNSSLFREAPPIIWIFLIRRRTESFNVEQILETAPSFPLSSKHVSIFTFSFWWNRSLPNHASPGADISPLILKYEHEQYTFNIKKHLFRHLIIC